MPTEQELRGAITWALAETRCRLGYYEVNRAYYDGRHRLTFATQKFKDTFGGMFQRFSDNLCPAVVDAVCDRLEVEAWDGPGNPAAQRIWDANDMEVVADDVHHEAVVTGDAYVIVWPGPDGEPRIYPQEADLCAVRYDTNNPGVILYGAKVWHEPAETGGNAYWRVNLYYPDGIWKYRTSRPVSSRPEKDELFVDYPDPDSDGLSFVPNPYGACPVFHFPNRASRGRYGRSELDEAIPVQDALNKSVCDMLVSMEFQAFRQRWATGIEVEVDEDTGQARGDMFVPGPGRIWMTAAADASFGEFGETDLTRFIAVSDSFRLAMARDTGTPLSYMFLDGAGSADSGEALKTKEARLVKKVKRRMRVFGGVWTQVLAFAGAIARERVDVTPIWENPETRDDLNETAVIEAKKRIGISTEQALRELGYTDAEISAMSDEKSAAAEAFASAALASFDRNAPVAESAGAAANGNGPPNA